MLLKNILTILFFLILLQSQSQSQKFTQKLLTATILSPGISYEQPISHKFTVKLSAVVAPNFMYSSSMLNGRSNLAFIPTALISTEGRYYYNFLKRSEKGKNISRNSANYIGVPGSYGLSFQTFYFEDGSRIRTTTQVYDFGIVWGLQRNYQNRFSLDFNIGPSILTPLISAEFGIISSFTLGIWLGKKTE